MRWQPMKLLLPALALAFLLAPVAVPAQDDGADPGNPGMQPRRMDMLAARLNLNDDQKAAVEKILTAHRDEMMQHFQEMRQARTALDDKIFADDFDENAIRTAAAGVAAVEENMAVSRAKLMKDMRGTLTADQYKTFAEMERRRGPDGAVGGRRGFHGPGPRGRRGPGAP